MTSLWKEGGQTFVTKCDKSRGRGVCGQFYARTCDVIYGRPHILNRSYLNPSTPCNVCFFSNENWSLNPL